jgi:hypothetical protein
LLPIAPTPLAVSARHHAPRFFSTGAWRDQVPAGATVGLMPFGWQSDLDMMQWQTEQNLDFKILNGYFLGPNPTRSDRQGNFGGGPDLLQAPLSESQTTRLIVTADQRAYWLRQLRDRHTTALVLPDDAPNADVVRDGAEQILGPGRHVEDSWIWLIPAR